MSERFSALKSLQIANMKTINRVREFLIQFDNKTINSTECYNKIKNTIMADVENEKDFFEKELFKQ